MGQRNILPTLLMTALVACAGCQQQEQPITLGETIEVTTETIGTDGGVITVDRPGDPLDGLTIEVPAGAYTESTTYKVSYQPIIRHSLGSEFTPLSPLISIENGSEFAEDVIVVTIPVSIPPDYFGMAFYYDEETGELDGLPLIDEDNSSLIVATRHFSSIVAAMIKRSELDKDVTSGFEHGVDDWQFENRGSWIAPKGHCSGQTTAALYYYLIKKIKEGRPSLYGLYDNDGDTTFKTPEFQYDDELAYKFCSMVQVTKDFSADSAEYWHQRQQRARTKYGDLYTLYCFAYSMILSGKSQQLPKPQYASVRGTLELEPGSPELVGHGLVVHKKSAKQMLNGREVVMLHVSNPNCPQHETGCKDDQAIIFYTDNNTFKPYVLRSDSDDDSTEYPFPEITFYPLKAFISRSDLDALWQEFENRTIGQGRFPGYSITVKDADMEVSLYDGYAVSGDSIDIKLCSTTQDFRKKLIIYKGTLLNGAASVTELSRHESADAEACITATIQGLDKGTNRLGFLVLGFQEKSWEYVGFDWIKVEREQDEEELHYRRASVSVKVNGNFEDSEGSAWTETFSNAESVYGSFSGEKFTGSWYMPVNGYVSANGTMIVDQRKQLVTSFDMDVLYLGAGFQESSSSRWSIHGAGLPETGRDALMGYLEYGANGASVCGYHLEITSHDNRTDASGQKKYSKDLTGYSCDDESRVSVTFWDN